MVKKIAVGGIVCFTALFCGSQVEANELIVESIPGATCALSTEGKQFDAFVMPDRGRPDYSLAFPHHYPDRVGEHVTVTCSKEGFETKTITFSKEPTHWISTGALCGPQANLSKEQQETYCLNYYEAYKMQNLGPPGMWFPRLRVMLEAKPEN